MDAMVGFFDRELEEIRGVMNPMGNRIRFEKITPTKTNFVNRRIEAPRKSQVVFFGEGKKNLEESR